MRHCPNVLQPRQFDYRSDGNCRYRLIADAMEGEKKMNPLYEVMTAAEAAELWGLSPITVRQACSGYKKAAPRFTEEEIRKAAGTWLITRTAMERVFGPQPK